MSFTYNPSIPNPPNNPSNDVGLMQENTNSIQSWMGIDHFTVGSANATNGMHTQMRISPVPSVPTVPNLFGCLYVKTINNKAQLFYTGGTTGDEYQLTNTSHGQFSEFGSNGALTVTAGCTASGGWTFLPGQGGTSIANGALVMQYGSVLCGNTVTANVTLPYVFTTAVFMVLVTKTNNNFLVTYSYSNTLTNLIINGGSSLNLSAFNFMLIGV